MLWGMCPKSKFASTEVVQICAALTCIRFNHGSSVYSDVLEELGILRGEHTCHALAEIDRRRVSAAERRATDAAKKARKRRRRRRKGIEDTVHQVEGDVYGSGIAD